MPSVRPPVPVQQQQQAQQQQAQQQQQVQQQQPHQQAPTQMQNFVRTTPIVPANLDPRTAPPPPPPAQPQNAAPPTEDRPERQNIIDEVFVTSRS